MAKLSTLEIYRNQSCLMTQIRHARHFWSRLRGLLGRRCLAANEGLLISPCNQVHTLGMRFPIDVLFLDAEGVIVKCVSQLRPFRLAGSRQAKHTLELAAGSIKAHALAPGQQLSWQAEAGR